MTPEVTGDNSDNTKDDLTNLLLSSLLLTCGWVSNQVEAECLSDAIVSQVHEEYTQARTKNHHRHQPVGAATTATTTAPSSPVEARNDELSSIWVVSIWKSVLDEYLGMTDDQSQELLGKLGVMIHQPQHKDENEKDSDEDEEQASMKDDNNNDDGDVDDEEDEELEVGEGQCELCDRYLRLTRHHLIPKSTWPRMVPLLQRATEALVDALVEKAAIKRNDVRTLNAESYHRAKTMLGPGLEHLIPRLLQQGIQHDPNTTSAKSTPSPPTTTTTTTARALKRIISHHTCLICAPCHRAVHKAHDNMTLARDYNTVEQLLQDENVYKFCKWASQQKPGRYAIK